MKIANRILRGGAAAFTLALIVITVLAMARPAHAQTEGVMYAFCSLTGCLDGGQPESNLIVDAQGNMYGATIERGAHGGGTVFKLEPDGTLAVLYSFCSVGGTKCTDGSAPLAGLVRDSAGNLYGATETGGASGVGTVFRLNSGGKLATLHSFAMDGTDGTYPTASLVMDPEGNLYGTTLSGGKYAAGTVYRIGPTGKESIMHSFGATSTDGAQPADVVLVMDRQGNLYGTTSHGGSNGAGTVFEITAGGAESVLYNFGATATDGISPYAGLTIDAEGNLYGATLGGGTNSEGTVFQISHSGTETILHNFQNNGTDGYECRAPLVRDALGNLYGVTFIGGQYNFGTVFEVSASGVETILHSFTGGKDGVNPAAGLLLDSSDHLYGTTYGGGTPGSGTLFEVRP